MRIQIIDDDYWCAEAIKAMVIGIDPHITFEYSDVPQQSDGCDIYIIDNEFEAESHAEELVRRVRRNNPESMIMACSGTMDRIRFKELINAGCDVAVEKGNAADRDTMMVAIRRYVLASQTRRRHLKLVHVIRDIRGILSSWNTRLELTDTYESSPAEVA